MLFTCKFFNSKISFTNGQAAFEPCARFETKNCIQSQPPDQLIHGYLTMFTLNFGQNQLG